jgi:orotate phosphoribosyltransferase
MNKVDKALCHKLLRRGLRNSLYYYESGSSAGSYVNLDTSLLGDDLQDDSKPQHEVFEWMANQFAVLIHELDEAEPFDRLAFIDKAGRGPVGLIALAALLSCKCEKPTVFVRPYRRTFRAAIRGKTLCTGEKILILSDVATTGQTIIKAAEKLWDNRVTVRGALVFFDHELGAGENLGAKDIKLYSLYTKREAREREPEIPLVDVKNLILHDFGHAV